MANKTNNLLKIFVIILVLVLIIAMVAKFGGSDEQVSQQPARQGDEDTQSESLAALSQQVVQLQAQLKAKEIKGAEELAVIKAQSEQKLEIITENLSTKNERVQSQFANKLAQLEAMIGQKFQGEKNVSVASQSTLVDGYVWHDVASGTSTQALTSIGKNNLGISSTNDAQSEDASVPVYTVPVNSTLMDSIGMTALIGRVPLGGNVTNPIPFKVVTGRKALLANGFELPEIAEAVWYGFATGDATLQCVSGKIESVTFIFNDGTIQTVGDEGFSSGLGLGWISNNQGVQCIPGTVVSNAPKIMSQLFAAGTATGFANATSQSQLTTSANTVGLSQTLTGDAFDFALGRGFGAGFSEWAAYIRERAKDQFDAVVVQPGAELAIHIQKEIQIDYNVSGRKVRYDTTKQPINLGVD